MAAGADGGSASVDAEAAAALGASLPAADVVRTAQHLRLPIRFESQEAEISALALLQLLDFGSGWDGLLLARARRGAAELAQFGVLGMLLSGGKLDAHQVRVRRRRTSWAALSSGALRHRPQARACHRPCLPTAGQHQLIPSLSALGHRRQRGVEGARAKV